MKVVITDKMIKKIFFIALGVLVFVILIIAIVQSFSKGHVSSNSTIMKDVAPTGKYLKYLEEHNYLNENLYNVEPIQLKASDESVVIDAGSTNETYILDIDSDHVHKERDDRGQEHNVTIPYDQIRDLNDKEVASQPTDKVIYTGATGSATWTFNVATAGFYNIQIDYVAEQSGGANIERKIVLDNAKNANNETIPPYDALLNVSFQRVWGDRAGAEKIIDINGNEIKPEQAEYFVRRTVYVEDSVGYVTEPYLIYLSEGQHSLSIEAVREAMSIYNVYLTPKEHYNSYNEVYNGWIADGARKVDNAAIVIEGEDSNLRSSSTLYAVSDRSSKFNTPHDHVKILLNVIGGAKWSTAGDWISWDLNITQPGLYKISLRCKQNSSRGLFAVRTVRINDEIPFAEAKNCKFNYSANYNIVTLGNNDGDFYFYLEQGHNTISLEASLGDYGSEINSVQSIIDNLNAVYRDIIAITGTSPDNFINYKLKERLPDLFDNKGTPDVENDGKFKEYANELREIAARITEISGEKSGETAALETMALQLEKFVKKPRNIQRNLSTFSSNISSLGTWILTVTEQTLTIDTLYVHSDDYKLPKANPNFFGDLGFKFVAFVKSFFFDYETIGKTEATAGYENIEVWLLTGGSAGREQANAIRTLVNSSFTHQYRINVNLKAVSSSVLLTATLSGNGPDVAIQADNGTPVNYAIRGAIYDLTRFDDFHYEIITDQTTGTVLGYDVKVDGENTSRWQYSAMTPYELETLNDKGEKHTGFYALPNTQGFLVMFYRTDIFEAQGWNVPQTWTDAINLIPELQFQNLSFYLPLNTVGASSVVNQIFASRLYQTGGGFYRTAINPNTNLEYMESNFDSEEAINAFEFWCSFYTDYSFSLSVSGSTFINRFRTGEMPIGIASYETYNTLAVSAPEIRGKWKFALLPGTIDDNGDLRIDGAAGGSAIMLMEQAKNPEGGWTFMKWWTRADTQIQYAREIESILGAAARHPTANVEAFQQLSWTVDELAVLMEQWEHTIGVPEVAGGYYTGRNLENAFRYVVNNKANPRETLDDYVRTINNEINRKRDEFGLGTSPDYYG